MKRKKKRRTVYVYSDIEREREITITRLTTASIDVKEKAFVCFAVD